MSIAAAIGTIGVAAATGDVANPKVYASENGGLCFTTDNTAPCPTTPAEVTIQVGEAVDFEFPGPYNPATPHNAMSASGNWSWSSGTPTADPQSTKTTPAFTTPGDYDFVCAVHGAMSGTIHVEGTSSTPTPDPTVSVTPTPQPGGGPSTTPTPSTSTDTTKPTVRQVRLTARKHAARVKFTLSEDSTVTIRVKRGKRVIKSVRLQATAGTRTVTVRSKKLKRGRYTVEVRARDASGNTSTLAAKKLRLRR